MSKYFKSVKPCPTDLTWKERNPYSYRFDVESLTKLEKAIKKFKKEKSKSSKIK